jgi:hypothetical protein
VNDNPAAMVESYFRMIFSEGTGFSWREHDHVDAAMASFRKEPIMLNRRAGA